MWQIWLLICRIKTVVRETINHSHLAKKLTKLGDAILSNFTSCIRDYSSCNLHMKSIDLHKTALTYNDQPFYFIFIGEN